MHSGRKERLGKRSKRSWQRLLRARELRSRGRVYLLSQLRALRLGKIQPRKSDKFYRSARGYQNQVLREGATHLTPLFIKGMTPAMPCIVSGFLFVPGSLQIFPVWP